MSIKQKMNKFFNNHSETVDKHWDKQLQTHYFKATKKTAFDTVTEYFKRKPGCNVIASSYERGEISVNFKGKRKAFITVTIIMVKPFRTAIDLSVTTEGGFFDLGYSHKLIPKLYNEFKKELTLLDTRS